MTFTFQVIDDKNVKNTLEPEDIVGHSPVHSETAEAFFTSDKAYPFDARAELEKLVGPVDENLDPKDGIWRVSEAVKRFVRCGKDSHCSHGVTVRRVEIDGQMLELPWYLAQNLEGWSRRMGAFDLAQVTDGTLKPVHIQNGPYLELRSDNPERRARGQKYNLGYFLGRSISPADEILADQMKDLILAMERAHEIAEKVIEATKTVPQVETTTHFLFWEHHDKKVSPEVWDKLGGASGIRKARLLILGDKETPSLKTLVDRAMGFFHDEGISKEDGVWVLNEARMRYPILAPLLMQLASDLYTIRKFASGNRPDNSFESVDPASFGRVDTISCSGKYCSENEEVLLDDLELPSLAFKRGGSLDFRGTPHIQEKQRPTEVQITYKP